ncbi:hypothetical protein PC128_g13549 [Phytophthora cactorum]|nr:hypothetical protein PC128_g13549 [Phytophthora cactorum]
MADPSLTPTQLAPDWQGRFFSAPGTPRQSSVAASAGGGNDGSSASEAPLVAHASPPNKKRRIVVVLPRSACWLTPLIA